MFKSSPSVVQFIKFGIVGISNTLVNFGVYALLVFFGMNYLLANFLAFSVSVVNSFIWNNRYVFEASPDARSRWVVFLKTYASYSVTGIFLTTVLLWLWISVFGINEYVAPLINIAFTVPINFVLNKYWAYK